jgi:hypothetical protein
MIGLVMAAPDKSLGVDSNRVVFALLDDTCSPHQDDFNVASLLRIVTRNV